MKKVLLTALVVGLLACVSAVQADTTTDATSTATSTVATSTTATSTTATSTTATSTATTTTTVASSTQELIASLNQKIVELQAQIASMQTTRHEAISSLVEQLQAGTRNEAVRRLQELLSQDESVYPEGAVTGYYGPLTVRAVNKFMAKFGKGTTTAPVVVSSSARAVAPGQYIAPGQAKKGNTPVVTSTVCNTLPRGIAKKLSLCAGAIDNGDSDDDDDDAEDTTAPVISSVKLEDINSDSAEITWDTDEEATSKVYFSTSTPVSLSGFYVSDSDLVKSHSITLTSLTASTTYYFIVESEDEAENTAVSSEGVFTTEE